MEEPEQRIEALKKVYAEMILSAAREAAARVLAAESKARRFEQDLACTRDEAARLLQRSRRLVDAQDKEAENRLLNQKTRFDELESQLNDAEMVILDLREELDEAQEQLSREKRKVRYSLLQTETEKITPEADSGYELTSSLEPGLELVTIDGNPSCSEQEKLNLRSLYADNLSEGTNYECDLRSSDDHSAFTHAKEPGMITSSTDSELELVATNDYRSFSERDTPNLKSCCPTKFTDNINSECDARCSNDHSVFTHEKEPDLFTSPLSSELELVTGLNNRSERNVHSRNGHNVFCHVEETELLTSPDTKREPITVKKPGLPTSLNSGLKLIAETYSSSSSDEEEPNICCPACAAEAGLVNGVCRKGEKSGPHSNSINSVNYMSVESASESEEEVQNENYETVSAVRRSSRKRTNKSWGDVLRSTRRRTSKPWADVHRSTNKRKIKPWGDARRSTREKTVKPLDDVAKFGVRRSRKFKKHGMARQQFSILKSKFKSAEDTFPTEDGIEIEENLGQEFSSRKFKLIEDLQNDMELVNVSVEQESEDAQMVVGSVDVVAEQDTEDLEKDTELIDVLIEPDELAATFDLNSVSTIVCDVIGDSMTKAPDGSNADTSKFYITYSRRKKKIKSLHEQNSSPGEAVH